MLAMTTAAMLSTHEGDRNVQLERNDVEVDGWTLGEVKAENMSAESSFLVVRRAALAVEEERKKVQQKQKHHLKVKTNKSAVRLILRL